MYVGSRAMTNPQDGLLVVGGYDTARVDGEFTTFPTFEDCATCLVANNITWIWEGGSTSLFANDSEILQIGLDPYQKGIDVPQHIYQKFLDATQGQYDPDLGLAIYDVNNPPRGNISVTLSNGYTTTILGDELFSKPRLYNNETAIYEISNDTVTIGLVTNFTEPGYVASWGMPFLTMNYLLMDHDNQEFKMAKAVRGDYGALISTICGPEQVPTSAPTTADSSNSSGGSNTGVIAGSVVGGVLGLALIICGVGYFFWRQNRNRKQQRQSEMAQSSGYGGTTAGARSEAGDTRASIFTSNYSELASPEQKWASPNMPSVNNWLMGQKGGIPEDVSGLNIDFVSSTNLIQQPYISATMNGPEPLEMPGDHYHPATPQTPQKQ
jgi:hypothetical protein